MLLELLDHGTSDQRFGAVTALGLMGDQRAAPRLLELLTGPLSAVLRPAVVDALGRLGHTPAAAALIAIAENAQESGSLRARAVRGLGLLGDPVAALTVVRALDEQAEAVRLRAAEALTSFPGADTAAALADLVASEDSRDVTRAALAALRTMGPSGRRALSSLLERVSAYPIWGWVAERRAECADSEDINWLAGQAALREVRYRDVAMASVAALARLRDPRAVPALITVLNREIDSRTDEDLHHAAIAGLAEIDDEGAVAAIVTHHANETWASCHSAARAAINAMASRGHLSPPLPGP
jgi:HEAT repeat protein